MSITDELREWISTVAWLDESVSHSHKNILAIADRIDIAHKHAIGYVDDRDPETMAEHGWVRLPKDADGVPIHAGDALTDGKHTYIVTSVTFDSFGVTVYGHSETNLSAWPIDQPGKMHHYHKHTVEDVLREFALAVCKDDALTIREGVVEEFAKRLTLAESEDA